MLIICNYTNEFSSNLVVCKWLDKSTWRHLFKLLPDNFIGCFEPYLVPFIAPFGPKSRIFQDRPLVSSRQRYTEQHGAYLLPIPMSFSHHYGMPAWEDSVFEYDFHVISQSDSSLRPLLVPSEHFSEGSQYLLFTFPRWPTVCISLLCVGAVARFTWPFSLSPAVPFSSLMALLVPTWCLPDLFFSWSLQLGEAESVHLSLLSRQVVLGSYPLVTAQDLRFQC